MDHYLDIKILPDPEFPPAMLVNALFTKLHRVLVQLQSKQIGISFPNVDQSKPFLGNVLRIHGTSSVLQNLLAQHWLKGMNDHLEVKAINAVPVDTPHCRVRRVQIKSNAERLRRRYRKRHEGVTELDALAMIPDTVEKQLSLPYLQLKSDSTGQRFRLFIVHSPPQQQPVAGEFNRYGLSAKATIPWF